jgi:hypothetical protein
MHSHAIVIKGPLLAFTRALLRFYLEGNASAVVFSHNTGGCMSNATLSFLVALRHRFPAAFDFVLKPPPPRLGVGFRNAQREACYHGVQHASKPTHLTYHKSPLHDVLRSTSTRLACHPQSFCAGVSPAPAVARFRPTHVLVHRPDSGFVVVNRANDFMLRLVQLEAAQPPISRPPRDAASAPARRLGFCGNQISLTDFYGEYHLDDHCLFGHASDVLQYWSVEAPSYRRDRPYSTSLSPSVRARRTECLVPGTESENGQLVRLLTVEPRRRMGFKLWAEMGQPSRERVARNDA